MMGEKIYMDHKITSIQDYIDEKTLQWYDAVDINIYQAEHVPHEDAHQGD